MEDVKPFDPVYEYNAPQYVDFTRQDIDDNADEYFNFDHEAGIPVKWMSVEEDSSIYEDAKAETNTPASKKPSTPASRRRSIRRASYTVHTPSQISSTIKRTASLKSTRKSTPRRTSRRTSVTASVGQENITEGTKSAENFTKTDNTEKEVHPPPNQCNSVSNLGKHTRSRTSNGVADINTGHNNHLQTLSNNELKQVQPPGEVRSCLQPKQAPAAKQQKHVRKSSGANHTRKPSDGTVKRNNTSLNKVKTIAKPNSTRSRTRTLSSGGKKLLSFMNCSNTSTTSSSSLPVKKSASAYTKRSSPSAKKQPPATKPKLTMAMTPSFMKRKSATSGVQVKTKEELELEKIHEMQKELAYRRKMAEESLRKAQTSAGYLPVRSAQPLTFPAEFKFETEKRIKSHEMETRSDAQNFVESLRQHHIPSKKVEQGVTIPQPFNLHERKRKWSSDQEVPNGKYTSMAEIFNKFSTQTPDRFRTRPKNKQGFQSSLSDEDNNWSKKAKHMHPKLTVPMTPQLQTRRRQRSKTVVSQKDIEDQEVEEMKKFQFHAKPVNEKIMKQPGSGVPSATPKSPTKTIEFHLHKNRHSHQVASNKDEDKFQFHARPVPTHIFKEPQGLAPPRENPVTVPQSPAFTFKYRLRSKAKSPEQPEFKPVRANPVPFVGVPFHPKLPHKMTEPQPFSFEERDKHMKAQKEHKIQEILEQEKKEREFKAQPLYDLSPELPPKRVKPATVPQPFHLEIDERGAKIAQEWNKKVEEELKQQRAATQFKARPATVIVKKPFLPKKSTKPLTDIRGIELNTDRRAEEWQEWEKFKHIKEMELTFQREAEEQRRQEEEEREIKRLRKEAIHKAQPVRKFKRVEILPSDKEPTMPQTPRFSERLKFRTGRI